MPDSGAQQEVDVVTTEQTDDKPSLLDLCKRREDEGMERTRTWVTMFQESLRYFLSDQLQGKKLHQDWDWVVLNYIWPSIMQEMAKLGRNYKIVASGRERSDAEAAEACQGCLQWQWQKGLHRHGMRIEQLRAILDGKLWGYRVSKILWDSKVRWDKQQRRWMGEVRHRLWNPAEFWASDKEYINDGDCGTVRWVELDYAISQWPAFETELRENAKSVPEPVTGGGEHVAGQTAAQGTYPSAGTGGSDKGSASSGTNTLLQLVLANDRSMGGSTNNERKYCRISECYLKDYTEIPQREETPVDPQMLEASGAIINNGVGYIDSAGNSVTAEQWPVNVEEWSEPKFPNGRYVIRCEDVILNPEEADQVYPHTVWPFVVIPHYLLPHLWQGTDAVTLYRGTQDMINVTVSHLVNNMKQFGNPRVAIEQDALAAPPGRTKKRFMIGRGAGSIIRLARGGLSRYRIEPPVAPSAAALQLYGLFAQEYKNFVGLQDIAQGKRGNNITATEAQFLAISANDRITLQNVFEEEWVKQIMSLTLELDQHYYEVGRFVRIVGDDQMLGIQQMTQYAKDAEFDIDIEPGQSLPYDEEKRILKYEKAYQMLQQPVPNPMLPDMLRILGIAGWDKLLKKYAAWQEFVAFEQLLNGVDSGQIDPQQALQKLVQRATQRLAQRQSERIPQGEQNDGNNRGGPQD